VWPTAPFFPERASEIARSVDQLFLFALAVLVIFSSLIAVLILAFAVRYRRRSEDEVGVDVYAANPAAAKRLEILWSVIPLAIALYMFVWGAEVYFAQSRPPSNAVRFLVTGRQWMWKIQHPQGRRELNELHVPVNTPIVLRMISEDVIHGFFVPAFRAHVDVLPSRYTTFWFEATRTGTFHLFCAEYCGVEHSRMVGRVIVMPQHEYVEWLASGSQGPAPAASGEEIFLARACNTCHRPDTAARAPILDGLHGKPVTLIDGSTVIADDDYLRESILRPAAKVVDGYQPVMPAYQGLITEEELMLLVEYLRSLGQPGDAGRPGGEAEE
jgi:cytochrome c oxidase subunit 2